MTLVSDITWDQIGRYKILDFSINHKNKIDITKAELIFIYKISTMYWCCVLTLKSAMRFGYQRLQKQNRK
jgi:hypothetical protein